MIQTIKNFIKNELLSPLIKEKDVVEAYDIWAENYDSQPGNLMLDLDQLLFLKLLDGTNIVDKTVADIGCGTGRHWAKILKNNPASLTGFDVSPGMLQKLREKFPQAQTSVITDNQFSEVAYDTFDVIVSTLTVAHIQNIEEALTAWSRIVKPNGEIIITDFHPDVLAFGGKRTFRHNETQIAVRNFVHSINTISDILASHGFKVVSREEEKIDEAVKHYYTAQNALHVYQKFKGFNVIYGIHFRRA